MDGNLNQKTLRNRALVFKCSEETFFSLLRLMKKEPDCYIVYMKSSEKKLFIEEE